MKVLSLKWRAVFGVTALTVAVLVLVSALQMHYMRRDFMRVLDDQQFALATRVAHDLDAKFDTYTGILARSAQGVPPAVLLSAPALRDYYDTRPGLLAVFDDVLVLSPDGRIIADSPQLPGRVGLSAADRPYFQSFLRSPRPTITEPVISKARGEPIVQILVPIMSKDGQLAGVLVGVIRLYNRNFLADLANTKIGKSGYFAIITKEAGPRYVVFPDKQRILQPRPANAAASTTRALAGFEGTLEDTTSTGKRLLFSYKSLKSVPWIMLAVIPVEEALSPIEEAEHRLWLIGFIVCLLVVPLVWIAARLMLGPLSALRDSIETLRGSGGDRVREPERHDEIGDLAKSFNRLLGERGAAEAKQRATEERLRMITDNLPALIAHMDTDLRYGFVNRTFAKWYGGAPADYLGRHLRDVIGEEGYKMVGPMAERALAGETASYQRELRESGELRHIEVSLVPALGPGGEVEGLYVLINDITALKRTKDELRAANAGLEQRVLERTAALEKSNRELEVFAYSVAHDFRSPLRAINGYSALLEEEFRGEMGEHARDYLGRMRAASVLLGQLIDDLLGLAQLTNRKMRNEAVDLGRVAGRILASLRTAQPGRDVAVVIAPDLAAQGDPDLLSLLLEQLIGNAWKFTVRNSDARIEIGIEPTQGANAYFVRDNGVGFDMAFAHKLFAPFARLHRAEEFPGTGIGLALAKRIVERHGGQIHAEATPGSGAVFRFTLPGS